MEAMGRVKETARRTAAAGLVLAASAGLTGCLTDGSTGPGGGGTVATSVSVTLPRQIGLPERPPSAFDVTVNDGENELVMEEIQVVIRDLVIKPADVTSCGSGNCIEYVGQAALLPLPTEGEVLPLDTRSLEVARYDRVDVGLHAPSSGEPVVDQNPEMEGVSVRIEGTFNGEPFTFETDVTADLQLPLSPALALESGTFSANVTILAGVTGWFTETDSGLVDPRTAGAGGENESLVESNIRTSFQAYRDDDRDGSPGSTGS